MKKTINKKIFTRFTFLVIFAITLMFSMTCTYNVQCQNICPPNTVTDILPSNNASFTVTGNAGSTYQVCFDLSLTPIVAVHPPPACKCPDADGSWVVYYKGTLFVACVGTTSLQSCQSLSPGGCGTSASGGCVCLPPGDYTFHFNWPDCYTGTITICEDCGNPC